MQDMRSSLLMVLLLPLLAACAVMPGQASGPEQSRIKVVTTTGMIADTVSHVGGPYVEVRALMGPGVDPHLYKASEGDVIRMAEADVIFYNGLHLEAKVADIFEHIRGQVLAVAVSDSIGRQKLLSPAAFEGNYDPHIWFDVSLWMKSVEPIRDTLIALDPTHAAFYRQNAATYLVRLAELHQYVAAQVDRIPERQRVLITAHDAFNYFGRAYDLEVRGLQGISTAAEAGTADLQDLAHFIVERRIPALFIESSVPTRYMEAVRATVRAQGFQVNIGGELFSDAMGTAGTPEGTYVGMVRHNVDTIVSALTSQSTERIGP